MIPNAGPYPPEAYLFVQQGLRFTIDRIRKSDPDVGDDGRHVDGAELCGGLRDFARQQYGLLARTVLDHWNIRRTEDFGRIVFNMVDLGLLRTSDEDSIEDFTRVYDFDASFEDVPASPSIRVVNKAARDMHA